MAHPEMRTASALTSPHPPSALTSLSAGMVAPVTRTACVLKSPCVTFLTAPTRPPEVTSASALLLSLLLAPRPPAGMVPPATSGACASLSLLALTAKNEENRCGRQATRHSRDQKLLALRASIFIFTDEVVGRDSSPSLLSCAFIPLDYFSTCEFVNQHARDKVRRLGDLQKFQAN